MQGALEWPVSSKQSTVAIVTATSAHLWGPIRGHVQSGYTFISKLHRKPPTHIGVCMLLRHIARVKPLFIQAVERSLVAHCTGHPEEGHRKPYEIAWQNLVYDCIQICDIVHFAGPCPHLRVCVGGSISQRLHIPLLPGCNLTVIHRRRKIDW